MSGGDTGPKIYFSDVFGLQPEVLEDYGAFNIALINDLPLFVDPFLLYDSQNHTYRSLHENIITYLCFLRDRAVAGELTPGAVEQWLHFKEIKQNWLGFSKTSNKGTGLGPKFAQALAQSLSSVFKDFGTETISNGSHIEKLTLTENVRLGLQARTPAANWNPWRSIDADHGLNEQARAMLARVDIRRPIDTLAEELSYGEQRQLELAITLATQPRIVLLDEPTAGMSPTETALILDLLVELLAGLTVVIVEHDLSVVDRVADRIVVLERGSVIADGTPAAVKADSRVQSAYLKGAAHA